MNLKQAMRRVGFAVSGLILILLLTAGGYFTAHYNPAPLSASEITEEVDQLNDEATVQGPHFKFADAELRRQHLALFTKVERGEVVSDSDAIQYRLLYQGILYGQQSFFGRFDRELKVLTDVGMSDSNNVRGMGIAGSHDHHDASARSNYEDLRAQLDGIAGASSSAASVYRGILAYKDTRDILFHLAPATHSKSVPYVPPTAAPRDTLDTLFETVLREYKLAQFEAINSPPFRQHMIDALDNYDALVQEVQRRVYAHQSPLQRTITGTFTGWQSLNYHVPHKSPLRISRAGLAGARPTQHLHQPVLSPLATGHEIHE